MKKVTALILLLILTFSVLAVWLFYSPRPLKIAGDSTLEQSEPLNVLEVQVLRTMETRLLDRFDFPNNHSVEFYLIYDNERSVAILETGTAGSHSITGIRELAGASPGTVWEALNSDGRELPRELRDLYGRPEGERADGWLSNRWLGGPAADVGTCNNDWFQTVVGTESAFPDAENHFLRFDRWDDSSGSKGGYYQFAGPVEIWHGGICLQQELQIDEHAPPGTAWFLYYIRTDDNLGYVQNLITPAFAPRPGQWGHWIWYQCNGCSEWIWTQVAAPNPGLNIQFDMGMDWTF